MVSKKTATQVKKAKETKTTKKVKKEEPKVSETVKKKKEDTPKEVVVEKSKVKKAKKTTSAEVPIQSFLNRQREEFIEILKEMLDMSDKPIGHLLFNGMFRLKQNKRLYEFEDGDLVKAFRTQLDIMNNRRQREISDETKNSLLKAMVE